MMKKIYTSPEARLMSFISAERLATGVIDFDDLMKVEIGTSTEGTTVSANDINLPATGNA